MSALAKRLTKSIKYENPLLFQMCAPIRKAHRSWRRRSRVWPVRNRARSRRIMPSFS
ncbi:protein of unknown function [Methylococcus capsulatus]|uniref:Uncharacterized protein n=1 Tax=Methylococcus capsulatus TaxID=414 RepID=A0AA35UFF8_METCP|nr:protein of unknown function [Methylococcus capsulatus]